MKLGHALGDSVFEGKSRRIGRDGSLVTSGQGWRLSVIKVVVVFLFLALLAGLARVQLFEGSYYRALADGNRVRQIPIHAPRGIIYDRNGVPLVANLPSFRLRSCDGQGKCTSESISKVEAIADQADGLAANQTLEVDSARSYLYGKTLAHLLGYVSQASAAELTSDNSLILGDVAGRGGVEQQYDRELRGNNGAEVVEVDANGKVLRTLSTVAPQAGQDLTLSIDLALQQIASEQILGKKAAVVATDPNTGSVLALASSPTFDPNIFTDLSEATDIQSQKVNQLFSDADEPLFNRAISGTYPAGSTFKIVTAMAGLESGKIDESYTITDPGILVIGPYKFPNWKYLQDGGTQGVLNVVGGLQKSNDIFFYTVGGLVGVDTIGQYAEKVGVGRGLGIDLPGEAPGLFPDAQWRAENARSWYLGDTYHLAIGQGDLLVTPLEDNAWTSVIANGGKLCVPHVTAAAAAKCQGLDISSKTIALIRQGMEAACVPGGTAYPLFGFKDGKGNPVQLACKTGTAEYGDSQGRTHAWLTAFAPADNPTIALTVLVEGGGGGGEGSDVAAPIAKNILQEWFK